MKRNQKHHKQLYCKRGNSLCGPVSGCWVVVKVIHVVAKCYGDSWLLGCSRWLHMCSCFAEMMHGHSKSQQVEDRLIYDLEKQLIG